MALTRNNFTGNGITTNYTIGWTYINATDVNVTINGTATTAFTVAGQVVTFSTPPADQSAIVIFRDTNNANMLAEFQAGSAIRAVDLNENYKQTLFVTQEADATSIRAETNSVNAVNTANTAETNSVNAVNTANTAEATANTALATISELVIYDGLNFVNDIPAVADDNKRYEVQDSTGIESFSPLTGLPANFVGSSDLRIRIRYNANESTYVFVSYDAVDPENQYVRLDKVAKSDPITVTVNNQDVTYGITAATQSARGTMSAADKTKIDGIEAGATADQTAAEIRTLVDAASDSNVFTDADHTKLDGIESGATADQTAAEIRILVGSATDSNVFTDADHTKLDGIEAGATADQTAAEIRTLVNAASNSNVFTDADHTKLNGIESGATADQTKADIDVLNIDADTLDGQHGSYYRNASNLNTGTIPDDRLPATISSDITGNADTVDNLHANQFIRSDQNDDVTGHTEWQDNYQVRLGSGADFRMEFDGTDTFFKSTPHSGGDIKFQAETSEGNNQNVVILDSSGTRTYARLFENGGERLKTTSGGITVTGTVTATTFSGALSGNASSATTATTATNCSRSISSGNGLTGGGALTANRTLTVQAANNTISVGSSGISVAGGNVTAGNATNSTNARIDHDTGNAWHRPVFIDDDKATATNQRLKTDNESTIGFNPSENKIRATTFVGTLNGNAVTASTSTNCGRSVISGSGLTGGGTLSQDRTLNVGAGSGISVSTDAVAVDSTVLRTTGDQTISNTKTFNGRVNIRGNIDLSDNEYVDFGSSDDVAIHFSSNNWLYCNFKTNGNGIVFQDGGADKIILEDSGIIRPSGNNTGTIGTSSRYWDNGYFQDFNISNNLNISNRIYVGSSDNSQAIEVDRSASYSTHLYIGGWATANSNDIARIRCSSNLHIDGPANGSCYINWYATNKNIYLGNTGQNVFAAGTNKVWHAGNDGSGSGLDADTVDGIQGGSFLRSDANDTATGNLTLNGNVYIGDQIRIGNDAWLEDFDVANTMRIKGNQNSNQGYLAFANRTTKLGCNNSNLLVYNEQFYATRVRAGDGTQNDAAFKFNGDDDTGMYRLGSNHMALITGGNRRHQIASSGQQIFSAQGAPTRAHLFKTAQSSSSNRYIISGYRNSSRADQADGTEVFRVRTNGGVQNTANQYTSLSDERLKENIVDAQSQWDDVKALRLVNFNFIEDVGFGPEKLLGFIAQEVEEICPQLVDTDDLDDEESMVPGQKSIKNSIIMTKGFGALQEAMARIEQLEARIAALEAP